MGRILPPLTSYAFALIATVEPRDNGCGCKIKNKQRKGKEGKIRKEIFYHVSRRGTVLYSSNKCTNERGSSCKVRARRNSGRSPSKHSTRRPIFPNSQLAPRFDRPRNGRRAPLEACDVCQAAAKHIAKRLHVDARCVERVWTWEWGGGDERGCCFGGRGMRGRTKRVWGGGRSRRGKGTWRSVGWEWWIGLAG